MFYNIYQNIIYKIIYQIIIITRPKKKDHLELNQIRNLLNFKFKIIQNIIEILQYYIHYSTAANSCTVVKSHISQSQIKSLNTQYNVTISLLFFKQNIKYKINRSQGKLIQLELSSSGRIVSMATTTGHNVGSGNADCSWGSRTRQVGKDH